MNKSYFLVILGVVIFIISLGIFLSSKAVAVDEGNLEECNVLEYNGEGNIDIVYFGTEDEAREYSEFLISSEPFNEYEDRFNFYYITPEQYNPECSLYKEIAVLCHNREIVKKAASCPGVDFIVALEEYDANIRSSSYQNIMSINTAHVLEVYLHEFGHAFGNFAEEYLTGQNPPRGAENCAATCEDFGENKDGCYEGCSKAELIRSIESGVMRTLSSGDYGEYNDRILRILIEEKTSDHIGITGRQISELNSCSDEEYMLSDIDLNSGEISNLVFQGCPADSQTSGDYSYAISDENGIVLSEGNIQAVIYYEEVLDSGELSGAPDLSHDLKIIISTPLISNAEVFRVKDFEGNIIAQSDIEYAGARPC